MTLNHLLTQYSGDQYKKILCFNNCKNSIITNRKQLLVMLTDKLRVSVGAGATTSAFR